jgi:hypothetical protein
LYLDDAKTKTKRLKCLAIREMACNTDFSYVIDFKNLKLIFEHLYVYHRHQFIQINKDYKTWYETEKVIKTFFQISYILLIFFFLLLQAFLSHRLLASDIQTTKDFIEYSDAIQVPSAIGMARVSQY